MLEAGTGELKGQMLGAGGVGRDERQVDLGLLSARELDLGLLGGLLEALEGHLVLAQIDALILAEFFDDPVDDDLVDVISTQVGVAVGGFDFHHPLTDLQNGDVEGTTTEVENGDDLVFLLLKAIGQGCRRRLVDDALHLPGRRCDRRPWWPGADCH